MNPTDKDTDKVGDARLDKHLRDHFAEQRNGIEAPDFDAIMSQAERIHGKRDSSGWSARLRGWLTDTKMTVQWGTGAAVTAALMVFVFYGTTHVSDGIGSSEPILAGLPDELSMTRQQLVDDINRTTSWQAPSDQWLVVRTSPIVFGLPELSDPSHIKLLNSVEEKNSWL